MNVLSPPQWPFITTRLILVGHLNSSFSCSYINQRNRERNVREAEEAAQREIEAAAGKGADPFTRRKCQPTVVTKIANCYIAHKN